MTSRERGDQHRWRHRPWIPLMAGNLLAVWLRDPWYQTSFPLLAIYTRTPCRSSTSQWQRRHCVIARLRVITKINDLGCTFFVTGYLTTVCACARLGAPSSSVFWLAMPHSEQRYYPFVPATRSIHLQIMSITSKRIMAEEEEAEKQCSSDDG